MQDEGERRGGDAGQRRGKRGRISDEGEEEAGDGGERRRRLENKERGRGNQR